MYRLACGYSPLVSVQLADETATHELQHVAAVLACHPALEDRKASLTHPNRVPKRPILAVIFHLEAFIYLMLLNRDQQEQLQR